MNTRDLYRDCCALLAAVYFGLQCATSAAVPMTLQIPAGVGGSGPGGFGGWTVSWEPNDNGNVVSVGPFSPVTNVLKLEKTFNNLDPIRITFTQNPVLVEEISPITGQPILVPRPPQANSPITGGLNIVLEEKITNATTKPWKAFRWMLTDDMLDPGLVSNGGANDAHPLFPHFHKATAVPMFPPFGAFSEFDPKQEILLTNGPFPIGHQDTWTGVRLHNREVKGHLRTFQLIQQPISEPSSMLLLAIGLAVLVNLVARRQM